MNILDSYNSLKKGNTPDTDTTLSAYVPVIGELDIKRGYIRRFFAQRANDKTAPVVEVSSNDYIQVSSSSHYRAVSIRWRIKVPLKLQIDDASNITDRGVEHSNRKAIELVSTKLPALRLYLVHLLQFYVK
jgi:hypothetical protein